MNNQDEVVKVCEVMLYEDNQEFKKLTKKEERNAQILTVKDKALKLLEILGGFARPDARSVLISQSIKINDYSKSDPVMFLYVISSML